MPFADRAAIFLKAADLIAGKYRYRIMAATMLGQGKNVWQAEIDAAAELVDFLRFNCKYAAELYAQQPPENSPGVWNRVEYRALDGFVYAVSPFNFTAIGGNLPGAPALMGNTVVWKPAPAAVYSNYLVYKALEEASLPAGVIQFIVGDAVMITDQVLSSPYFSALHFTGSTVVFKMLWKKIADNMHLYRSYPRIVGETGGKNFHMVHKSANVDHVVFNTIRATFENQGQKCSACSRMYVPASLWPAMKAKLVEETQKITVGPVHEFQHFVSAVIDARAFNKIKGYIEEAKLDKESSIVVGGVCDDTTGYYIHPTIIETTNPKSRTMVDEIFGPVLTVYVYADDDFEQTLDLVASTSEYALTGAVFAQDRQAVITASSKLRHAAGNFYINDKCTGAVVGQQPFGGSMASGTNDKAGSASLLSRFVSMRSIKENFIPLNDFGYPSNMP